MGTCTDDLGANVGRWERRGYPILANGADSTVNQSRRLPDMALPDGAKHEQARKLLGQQPDGALLQKPENSVGAGARLWRF